MSCPAFAPFGSAAIVVIVNATAFVTMPTPGIKPFGAAVTCTIPFPFSIVDGALSAKCLYNVIYRSDGHNRDIEENR